MHDLNESRRFEEGPPAEVSTAGLRSSRIPSPDGPVEPLPESLPAIWVFALTFDPRNFASETTITFLSDSARGVYERTGALPDLDLEALRACLANEHQYWRATGPGGVLPRGSTWDEVEPAHAAFVRALLREIVTRVFHEESWWWDPNHQPSIDERQGRTIGRSREGSRLARLYDLAEEHLADMTSTYEGGLPADEKLIAEALDPPVVHDPEPTDETPPTQLPDAFLEHRQLTVQRLAVGLFFAASGSGFDRVRGAQALASEAAALLRGE